MPLTARPAVAGLVAYAAADVLRAVVAVGAYEEDVTVYTHDSPDVGLPWVVYHLVAVVAPDGDASGLLARLWVLALLAAAGAVAAWLVRAHRRAATLPPGGPRWTPGWPLPHLPDDPPVPTREPPVRAFLVALASAAALHLAVAALGAAAWNPEPHLDDLLVGRRWAYPLLLGTTAAAVTTAVLGVRVVRRFTDALRADTARP